MASISTYVFIDLETTGLPSEENNKTKITELCMVAVKRSHLLDTRPGSSPRVQHKLTLCFNPGRFIAPTCTETTGLCNDLLEYETTFSLQAFNVINNFLNLLQKPVCFIAHNGLHFDFPILKNHFEKLKVSLSEDLMCADSFHAFYDIMEERKRVNLREIQSMSRVVNETGNENKIVQKKSDSNQDGCPNIIQNETSIDEVDLLAPNTLQMKLQNESTPKQAPRLATNSIGTPRKEDRSKITKARRRFPWSAGSRPTEKYKLKDIYERLLNRPAVDAHRAENDCMFALECAVVLGKDFVKWVDENFVLFTEVKPMTIGVRIGLIVLTGLLWGCTNPLIRQGTRGLRDVRGKSRLGQFYAEVIFLMGNWRYVLPWLVNQAGSISYLLAVRRAPLSLCVPAANALAFAFTAIAGAALGREEPLDKGSILGIAFIVAGTALCCWDKAE